MYTKDLGKIYNDIQVLSDRVSGVEEKFVNQNTESRLENEEGIIFEMEERQRCARNVILYNVEESNGSKEDKKGDMNRARRTLSKIQLSGVDVLSTWRIGKRRHDYCRPLRISLSSPSEVLAILRNKGNYSGLVELRQDRTKKQREYLKSVKNRLENLRSSGIKVKTIRYINGIPKIVNIPVRHEKN